MAVGASVAILAVVFPLVIGTNGQLKAGVVVVFAIAFAFGVVLVRERFVSALLIGGVGFSCAVLFALFGAPDLALTQFLVETLTLVIFVLVLRTLPAEAEIRRILALWSGARGRTRVPVTGNSGAPDSLHSATSVAASSRHSAPMSVRVSRLAE